MKILKPSSAELQHLKVLLYGDSGAGKTFAAASAGSKNFPVAILETEANGMLSIQASNPNALVIRASSIADVEEFIVDVKNPKGELRGKHGVKVVAIDSLTEIQRLVKEDIVGNGQASLQQWLFITERMRRLIRAIRDLDIHVVCTCLAVTKYDSDQIRQVVPCFEGQKLHIECPQYFSAVGYVYKDILEEEGKNFVLHRVMFSGPSTYMCKVAAPLAAVETANVRDWIERCTTYTPTGDGHGKTEVASDPIKKPTTGRRRRSA